MKLIINKIGYRLNLEKASLYYSFENNIGLERDINILLNKYKAERPSLKNESLREILLRKKNVNDHSKNILNKENNYESSKKIINEKSIDDKAKVYFSFFSANEKNFIEIDLEEERYFKELYVKEYLQSYFRKKYFIGKSVSGGFSIYINNQQSDIDEWEKFTVYNIMISQKTITLALASKSTYISQKTVSQLNINSNDLTNLLFDNEVIHKNDLKEKELENSKVVANKNIKRSLNISPYTGKFFYKKYFEEIESFYKKELLCIKDNITFYESGFNEVSLKEDVKFVEKERSEMVFKDMAKNVNATNGMKRNGPFKGISDDRINNLSFIFIYSNAQDANDLFKYLKNGFRHFPGLESYIGIPVRPNKELSLKYSSFENLKDEFGNFIKNILLKDNYSDIFAFYISPYKKDEVEGEESDTYFFIKENLLKKGIPSQVIAVRNIHSENFHFSLPNISIAILAKLGGVPWKLARDDYEELIVGFGNIKSQQGNYLGNTVFFNNSGEIKKINSFPSTRDLSGIGRIIKTSILQYLTESQQNPKKIVIHYYKPPNKYEMNIIAKSLTDLGLEIPYVVVEINDTKAKDFICFDADYDMGMPKSGTIVLLRKNEYLLFNNSRYEEKPSGYISDEYPIKVRIHHTAGLKFDIESQIRLIDQVYEFSRMYWKSLRQQSHPVTVKYAKLIAEFACHFEQHLIPANHLAQTTTWFI